MSAQPPRPAGNPALDTATAKKPDGQAPDPRTDAKARNLEPNRTPDSEQITTNQGLVIADNHNSLKAGPRGPSLLEDFHLREKITHFDHERIPERVVHARGEAAHGYFELHESMSSYTMADFLQKPGTKTPVFLRFSTVAGSRGSADTVRDVRGFAVKFYTQEGNFDLVGNNIPIFFIQDAIKFPDLIHAVKPEPHNEMPQAASAHDTFWDFISLMPESTHMVMWAMSDRAIPRSHRMMEGFGIHTFRLVNAAGESTFVKFHWKPRLGMHGLVWDEAQKLAGKDADFHRRDLWEAIEEGDYPQWDFGMQLFTEAEADKFDFDVLDPTKIVPEELVPVKLVGTLTLNRNPDNFFAETEQVAFHPGSVVPGIDFSNDPLLQGRLFSYTDTQLLRLGGPNFHEIPINRPVCPFRNHQRDGLQRHTINTGRVSYEPNSLSTGKPVRVEGNVPGFQTFPERIEAPKLRIRAESFADHFTQARLFYISQTPVEQDHIVDAFSFELGKVETPAVRERMVTQLAKVDGALAARIGAQLGLAINKDGMAAPASGSVIAAALAAAKPEPQSTAMVIPRLGDGRSTDSNPPIANASVRPSAALSMVARAQAAAAKAPNIATRKVAVLVADGVDAKAVNAMKKALTAQGAKVKVLAARLGMLDTADGKTLAIDATVLGMPSVMFDAVFVPGGAGSVAVLRVSGDMLHFVLEAFRHGKAIAAHGAGIGLLSAAGIGVPGNAGDPLPEGVVVADEAAKVEALAADFVAAIAPHRHWTRARKDAVPA